MSSEILHRGRLGEQILRDDAFEQVYNDTIEECVSQMLSLPPNDPKVAELHTEMVMTQRLAYRFASWVEQSKIEIEKQQA
jgi:hypothetical protein